MIGFDLTDEQLELQAALREYLAEQCPTARALEAHGQAAPDYALWQGLMELGAGGICVPEEYGGLGLGLLELATIAELTGRYAMPGPFLEHALATYAIAQFGSAAQKAEWLVKLSTGEARGTVALAEGEGVWLADDWQMPEAATLTGVKKNVLHAQGVDIIIAGLAGGKLVLIRPDETVTMAARPCIDGGKRMANVTFSNTAFESLPHGGGAALCNAALILLTADSFGGAAQGMALTIAYVKEREQFGRPVGAFQAVQHKLAEMAVAIEPAVGIYWHAAFAQDQKLPSAAREAALAKSYLTETYAESSRAMIELSGGIGYTWEYGAHVWLKRALFNRNFFGTPRTHRLRAATLSGW
jgi:alkylation response protein AidB-like acyl-CoA dehydrogenase